MCYYLYNKLRPRLFLCDCICFMFMYLQEIHVKFEAFFIDRLVKTKDTLIKFLMSDSISTK